MRIGLCAPDALLRFFWDRSYLRVVGMRVRASMERTMPQGDKSAYTDKQKRKAEHIEEGYEERGTPKKEAERRAWATVNKKSGGGKKSGSGRGKKENHDSARKGGQKSGSSQSAEKRSAAAKKGWETRRQRGSA
jgi:plasmid stabilization system protein ParE